MARRDVAQEVTDRILEALEGGTVPWRVPWRAAGGQRNLQSGKAYRGINAVLTEMTAQAFDYPDPFWTTYRAAEKSGGQVRKGEKGTLVTFWKPWEREETDSETGKKAKRRGLILKHYTVFNVAQCDGLEVPKLEVETVDPLEVGEAIIRDMPDAPPISYGGDSAFYVPASDRIQLPTRDQFENAGRFYAVAFHEMTHSTGHSSRLDRGLDNGALAPFGSADYSREELVAELGSAFLCGSAGIDGDLEQAAAYIDGWRRKLSDDPKLILQAAGKAQKAADFILGATFEPRPE